MVSSTYSAARMIASASINIAAITACSASSEYGGRRSRYGSRGGEAIEYSTGELDIFPGGALPGGVAQQRCGMVRDDQRHAVVSVHGAPQLADRRLRVEQRLGGERPEGEDDLRPDELKLADQVGAACLHLVRLRVPVLGRAVLEHVRDEHVLPGQLNGREDFRQQLSG